MSVDENGFDGEKVVVSLKLIDHALVGSDDHNTTLLGVRRCRVDSSHSESCVCSKFNGKDNVKIHCQY